MEVKQISSLQNPLVKEVLRLSEKSSERRKTGQFIVEGVREVSLAIQAGHKINTLIICREIYQPDHLYPVKPEMSGAGVFEVTPAVYAKMAYRGHAEGVLAVVEKFDTKIDNIVLSENPIILLLESVEKPGNLGAILRTADAAGVDAVVICDPATDVYNPNVIRSSLGCVFSVQIAVCDHKQWFSWAKKNSIKTILASLQAEKHHFEADLTQPLALVFGTEADGLSPVWYEHADEKLKIPMKGKIDSLNVSASAAILVFEVVRQRMVKQH
jgi:RNA methyltransferase, TrmH family